MGDGLTHAHAHAHALEAGVSLARRPARPLLLIKINDLEREARNTETTSIRVSCAQGLHRRRRRPSSKRPRAPRRAMRSAQILQGPHKSCQGHATAETDS